MCVFGGPKPTKPSASPGCRGSVGGVAKCPKAKAFPPGVQQALKDQRKMLEARKKELKRWNKADQARFKKYFGSTDEKNRKAMRDRIDKMLKLNKSMKPENFARGDPPKDNRFAYVYPNDKKHKIYLDKAFDKAPATGKDSKAGTIAHEMSHFNDIGGTKDHVYGKSNAEALAKSNPAKAMGNADNFEYYCEEP